MLNKKLILILGNIEPISKYYKSKLFDFLRVVLVSNNKPMRLN